MQVVNVYGKHQEGPVSCWRKVFVANEFTELSAIRRTQPALTFSILVRNLFGFANTDSNLESLCSCCKASTSDLQSCLLITPAVVQQSLYMGVSMPLVPLERLDETGVARPCRSSAWRRLVGVTPCTPTETTVAPAVQQAVACCRAATFWRSEWLQAPFS